MGVSKGASMERILQYMAGEGAVQCRPAVPPRRTALGCTLFCLAPLHLRHPTPRPFHAPDTLPLTHPHSLPPTRPHPFHPAGYDGPAETDFVFVGGHFLARDENVFTLFEGQEPGAGGAAAAQQQVRGGGGKVEVGAGSWQPRAQPPCAPLLRRAWSALAPSNVVFFTSFATSCHPAVAPCHTLRVLRRAAPRCAGRRPAHNAADPRHRPPPLCHHTRQQGPLSQPHRLQQQPGCAARGAGDRWRRRGGARRRRGRRGCGSGAAAG